MDGLPAIPGGGSEPAVPDDKRRFWLVGAYYGLAVLIVANIFGAIDRLILILVTENLKIDLALSDVQVGVLNGVALTFVALLATFPMGWLADRINRRILLAVCVLLWSIATAACGFAETFNELFICSMGVAVGEAVLGPIVYSMIPDLFPANRRVAANYIFYVAAMLGNSAGLFLGGTLISAVEPIRDLLPALPADFDTWRIALIAASVPGPLIAFLVVMIPLKKRYLSKESGDSAGLVAFFRQHARTLFAVFVGFGFVAAARTPAERWGPVALIRDFGESAAETGVRLGIVDAVASVTGVISSWLIYRAVRARSGSVAALRTAQYGTWAAVLLVPFYLVAATPVHMYLLTGALTIATTTALSITPTILQDIAPPQIRGRVIALGALSYVLLNSLGPMMVGVLSDTLGSGTRSLLLAMTLVTAPCFAIGAILLRLGENTLPLTLAAVKAADESTVPADSAGLRDQASQSR